MRNPTRADIDAAAARLGITPTPMQRDLVVNLFSDDLMRSGRGGGKTTALKIAVELDRMYDERKLT